MKFFIKKRLQNLQHLSLDFTKKDINEANTILFSVFSRYGDGLISFSIIKEFISKYPDKHYIVLTSRQQFPYAIAILETYQKIVIKKVNKRNPLSFFKTISFLKHTTIDIAFNPWGHGEDSEYFSTFAKKFSFYKKFDTFPKTYNLYDRIREYFLLDVIKNKNLQSFSIENKKNIIIAPISTDITKNLSIEYINAIIHLFRTKNPTVKIIVALPTNFKQMRIHADKFIFGKSTKNSYEYLQMIKTSDLFIGVDSGPLHLALALHIDSIGIFGPTSPATILDHEQKILFIRDKKMQNHFCFVKNCKDPICINPTLIKQIDLIDNTLDQEIILKTNQCLMKEI